MMKKYGMLFLLILSLTACQPAKPQADSVSEGKTEQTVADNQEQKQEQKQDSQTEQKQETKEGETGKEEPAKPKKVKPLDTRIEDMAGYSVQAENDFYRNYYEIYVASFYDSDGDGVGDLKGITEKLSYIEGMGFTGLWLMPIHPSNTYHKYDVKDYYQIDSSYGTMEDMQRLLDMTAEMNISVLIDLVVNHTADDHVWFQEAVQYLKGLPKDAEPKVEDCKYVDYYHFTRDAGKGKSYHQIAGTDWYYEGVFWGEMPDLNVNNPEVRAEIEKIMDFWLEKGVDGFRLDAVKEFFTGHTQKNVEFLSWLYQAAKAKKADVYMVGEAWSNFAEIGEYYGSGIPSFFNYALATAEGKIPQVVNKKNAKHSAASFAEAMIKIDDTFGKKNPNYVDAPFVANHDNVRMASYFKSDEDKMKLAAGMYLTMTGATFTYYGEEIGMVSSGSKDENKRTAMVWNENGQNIAKNPKDAEVFEQKAEPVSVQQANEQSLLRYYQKALRMRQEIPAISRGKVKVLSEYSDQDVAVVEKTWQGSTIRIVYNISAEKKQLDFSAEKRPEDKLLNYLCNDVEDAPVLEGTKLSLPAYSIAVIQVN